MQTSQVSPSSVAHRSCLTGRSNKWINGLELGGALGRNVIEVEAFSEHKYLLIRLKTTALRKHYGIRLDCLDTADLNGWDQHQLEGVLAALIELRDELKKLQWYRKVNRDCLQRIARKLDTCPPGSSQHLYQHADFLLASQAPCLKDLEQVNMSLAVLSRASFQQRPSANHVSLSDEDVSTQCNPSLAFREAMYHAIRNDDASTLNDLLQAQASEDQAPGTGLQALLIPLLQFSISYKSGSCIDQLLSRAESLDNVASLDDSKFLHHLLIRIGRKSTLKRQQTQELQLYESIISIHTDQEPSLTFMLSRLRTSPRYALQGRDLYGRLPLHYACQYGLVEACRGILIWMCSWEQLGAPHNADPILMQDLEGYTPLHLSVIGGHTAVTRILLEFCKLNGGTDKMEDLQNLNTALGASLAIALRSNFTEIVELLSGNSVNINYQGKWGETALYIAAQSGREDFVKPIIEALSNEKANIDVAETVYGRSPLLIASVEGHLPIVKLLLDAGADAGICDHLGWTAKEHAAFRGHMMVAETLGRANAPAPASIPGSARSNTEAGASYLRSHYDLQNGERNTSSSFHLPQRHDTSTNSSESQIFVNLGSFDTRKHVIPVDLSPYLSPDAGPPRLETGFSVRIQAVGGSGLSHEIQLPVLEDTTNEPLLFSATDPSEVKLEFNIFHTSTSTDRGSVQRDAVLIGSGVAILKNLKQGLKSKRETLIRDYAIPILGRETLKFIGSVSFSFMIVTPFPRLVDTSTRSHELLRGEGPTKVIGHRGSDSFFALIMSHIQIAHRTRSEHRRSRAPANRREHDAGKYRSRQ